MSADIKSLPGPRADEVLFRAPGGQPRESPPHGTQVFETFSSNNASSLPYTVGYAIALRLLDKFKATEPARSPHVSEQVLPPLAPNNFPLPKGLGWPSILPEPWRGRRFGREPWQPQVRRWAGYYCAIGTKLDPPMDIQLELSHSSGRRPLSPSIPREIRFVGRGHDRVGSFDLTGSVDPQTGRVSAIKAYLNAHSWEWAGVWMDDGMGMIGMWDHPQASSKFRSGQMWWIWPCDDPLPST